MNTLICCPRCGHHNPARARFCAQCGVNLSLAGAESPTWPHPRPRRRWPAFLLLFFLVILGGVWLLGIALQTSVVNHHLAVPCEQPEVQVHERAHSDDERVITRESTWIIEYP